MLVGSGSNENYRYFIHKNGRGYYNLFICDHNFKAEAVRYGISFKECHDVINSVIRGLTK